MAPKTLEERDEIGQKPYRPLVGQFMYLAIATRPDLASPVRELARYMSDPGLRHWEAAKHLMRYLARTQKFVITYDAESPEGKSTVVKGYTDASWAAQKGRKSVSGYVFLLAGGAISWSSKQQAVVASSCESEYIAITHAAKQAIWTRHICQELTFPQSLPTTLYCDSTTRGPSPALTTHNNTLQ